MTIRPTLHQLRAAARVARMIDVDGNAQIDIRSSYRTAATLGEHPPASLRDAETLLLKSGLLLLVDDRLLASSALRQFLAFEDEAEATHALAILIEDHDTEDPRTSIGCAGEEHVARGLRQELEDLDLPNLARLVQRVSLLSDRFGYDIRAPTVDARMVRKLEVKTQSDQTLRGITRFFLSRNEFDVGRRDPSEWALVVCTYVGSTQEINTLGWCRAMTLLPYLPDDRNGRWTEALVQVPVSLLIEGYPPAI